MRQVNNNLTYETRRKNLKLKFVKIKIGFIEENALSSVTINKTMN